MADTTPKEAKISIKVMVHKAKNRAIYAEADSSFVDILLSFLTLPLTTIVKILGKCPDQKVQALGSLKNLCQSLTDLPTSYLSADESKDMLLDARSSSYYICRKLKINIDDTDPPKFLTCPAHYRGPYFSTYNTARCCHCGKMMTLDLEIGHPSIDTIGDGVFVSDVTTFIVTEDLRVLPNASGVSIQLLCDSGILDASQIEERSYDFGIEQILMFFKGALSFKYPLTYLVFPSTHLTREHFNLRPRTLIQHVTRKEIATTSKKMMLKITLQKSTSNFLFAEAEEDFVDFVFGFLQIPLGTVTGKLMNGNTSIDNLDNLFASVSEMKVGKHIMSEDLKKKLLQPKVVHNYISQNNIFSLEVPEVSQYFPAAGRSLILKDVRVQGGFVKASAKFMLTDDLVITPLSTFSTIAVLNKLKVPLNDVVEHELSIGLEEGLKILKAALISSLKCLSPLTDALPK
uniref:DUF674 domain-containing protein n=1 Tax=Tanacetum cinerariifolium TaxID=118510 RepID=A0A6L2K301_TANCI|nr:hypothetical protein [Tanacetum cinerariifolium]